MGITARTHGNVAKDLNGYVKRLRAAAATVVAEETDAVAADVRRGAPRRSGDLARSIKADVRERTGKVTVDVPYAIHVEYGTSGRRGQRAQPFIRPAAATAERRFVDRARRRLRAVR